jgi:hypothetical protein
MTTLSPQSAVLTRRLLTQSWKVSLRLWPATAIVTIVIGAVIAQFTPITVSIWEYASIWPRWFLFTVGLTVVSGYLPLLVVNGMTRRDVLTALGLTSVVGSLCWAAFMTAGMVVERAVYSWLDWTHVVDGGYLFHGDSSVVGLLGEYGLLFLGYLVAGSLIAAAYYRFGVKAGSWLLPLTLLPVIVLEALLSGDWTGTAERLSSAWSATLVGLIGSLLLIGLTGLADYLLLRDVPIHGKAS